MRYTNLRLTYLLTSCARPNCVHTPQQLRRTRAVRTNELNASNDLTDYRQHRIYLFIYKCTAKDGGAEFAGQENEGRRNFRGWKMQDLKRTDKSAGLENAGLENDGQTIKYRMLNYIFPVLQIPAVHLCPSFSSPAFSCPANSVASRLSLTCCSEQSYKRSQYLKDKVR